MDDQGSLPTFPGGGGDEVHMDASPYASWGRRAGAYIIDGVIVLVVALAIAKGVGIHHVETSVTTGTGKHKSKFGHLRPEFVLIYLGVVIVYAFAFLASKWRATPAMRLLRIRLSADGGGEATIRNVAIRTLVQGFILAVGSVSPILGLVGLVDFLWPIWDRQNRTYHDKLGGTVVLVSSPPT